GTIKPVVSTAAPSIAPPTPGQATLAQ
ncbi:MAG: hypothetical protein JWL96_758, partial [Sphingomonas bacterium]|nr:hypothetical protein [Sphingomonas bacterium]